MKILFQICKFFKFSFVKIMKRYYVKKKYQMNNYLK